MRTFSYFITALTLALTLSRVIPAVAMSASISEPGKAPLQQPANPQAPNNLRGVFYTSPENGPVTPVGRLAVLLLGPEDDHQQVDLQHRFHTGESFQFIISSNHDGWLYILHRSPAGEPQLLWPRVESGAAARHLDYNQVEAGLDSIVPASPGKFTFDDEIGNEYFYVVIRPERRPPELSAMDTAAVSDSAAPAGTVPLLEEKAETAEKPVTKRPPPAVAGQKIVQFSIRGRQHPIRGVIYDPGPQDDDPHTYFSSPPEDGLEDIVMEFKLLHER